MPYTAPTGAALLATLRRDLRDTNATVSEQIFVDAQIEDFVNLGLAELNIERPIEDEVVVDTGDVDDLDGLDLPYIWAIELYNVETRNRNYIDKADADVRWLNGWRIYNGQLDLPKGIEDIINTGLADSTLEVHVFGYRDRARWALAAVPDLEDLSDEAALRLFVRAQGFKALTEDRALFQQWQTQANNSDVSATQLLGMVDAATRDWERTIARIRRVMRSEV